MVLMRVGPSSVEWSADDELRDGRGLELGPVAATKEKLLELHHDRISPPRNLSSGR